MRMNVSLFSFIRSALIALIFSRYTNAKREPRGRATCTRRRDVRAPHVALVSYVAQRTRCSELYATLFVIAFRFIDFHLLVKPGRWV